MLLDCTRTQLYSRPRENRSADLHASAKDACATAMPVDPRGQIWQAIRPADEKKPCGQSWHLARASHTTTW